MTEKWGIIIYKLPEGNLPQKKLDFWQTACYIIKESGVYRFRQTGVILCCR